MSKNVGIHSIVQAVIIVYYANRGETMDEAVRIADLYMAQLKEQILMEAAQDEVG